MNDKKVVMYLFGYSCSGKSTVEALVGEGYPDLYTIDYDVQKKQLSGYHRHKDSAYIKEIDLGFFEVICKTGKSVLLASTLFENEGEYLAYAKVADTYGYEFHSFQFTASRDVLISRYRERLDHYKSKEEEDSLKSEEEYLDTFKKSYYIPENTATFNTSDMSSQQVATQILARIEHSIS